jgi:hypothetical protein
MKKVVIETYGQYTAASKLPNGKTVVGTINSLNTMEGFLEEKNGIWSLYIPSKLPFATKRTLSQKLGLMAQEALISASNEKSLCTVVGSVKVMNKLLNKE